MASPHNEPDSVYKDICCGFELLRILDLLGARLERIGLFDDYVINLLDEKRENLLSMKLRFVEPEFKALEKAYFRYKYPLQDDSNINARVFKLRHLQKIDAENGSADERRMQQLWKVDQIVSLPFSFSGAAGQPIGTILVTRQSGTIDNSAYPAIQEVMDQFYPAVCAALRYFYLTEKQDEFETAGEEKGRFLDFICALSDHTDLEEIFGLFSAELARRLPFEIFTYYLLEDGHLVGKNVTITAENYQAQSESWKQTVVGTKYVPHNPVNPISHAFILNRHLLFEDAQSIVDIAEHRDPKAMGKIAENAEAISPAIQKMERTLLFVPIRHRKNPIGVCALHALSSTVTVSVADLRLVEQLCMFLGAEISNARNFMIQQEQHREIARLNSLLQGQVTELSEQASRDQLTGLYNFRSFRSEITRRLARSQNARDDSSLSIAIVDIDHFKTFNDTYGHAAGNTVLAGVAREIDKLVRKHDVACRYGGEEFVVLLDNCGIEGVRIFAERMRNVIAEARFEIDGAMRSVTVSIGCAASTSQDTPDSLFERGDAALYQAKHNGRNRVELQASPAQPATAS